MIEVDAKKEPAGDEGHTVVKRPYSEPS